MKINEKIKWIRERSGLSQEDMAEKLGLATSTYSKMEQGRINRPLAKVS
ncbi:helix-turn-helix domain-containing protein [Neisseria sp. P0008.S010]